MMIVVGSWCVCVMIDSDEMVLLRLMLLFSSKLCLSVINLVICVWYG